MSKKKAWEGVWELAQKHKIEQIEGEIKALYDMLPRKSRGIALEIGCKNGGSAAVWRSLYGRVICVDVKPSPLFDPKALKVELVQGYSHEESTLDQVKEALNGKKVDFLFIDGWHGLKQVQLDHEIYAPLVKQGGYIGFHDIVGSTNHRIQNCHVDRYWNRIKNQYDYWEWKEKDDPRSGWAGIGLIKIG